MQVEVFYAVEFTGRYDDGAPLVHVATVEAPANLSEGAALEFAWMRTQNVAGSWSRGAEIDGWPNQDHDPSVTVRAPLPNVRGVLYGHRSSSVGDVFVIGEHRYTVAPLGFDQV